MFNLAEWFLTGALMASPVTSTAQMNDPAPVTAEAVAFDESRALANANEALNAISTAKGRFEQIDPSGARSEGSFYLSRPGKMRFEYDDPNPVTLVSDGTTVAIEDRDLETVDRVPLASTPLGLILRKNADLAEHANILAVTDKGEFISVRLSDKSGEAEGELELYFTADTYKLAKWITLDAYGQQTRVSLLDIEEGMNLSPRLFRVEDPEDEDDRDR